MIIISICCFGQHCLITVYIKASKTCLDNITVHLYTADNLCEDKSFSYVVVCDPPCVQGACVANDTCNCMMGYVGERCDEAGR